MFSCEFYKIFKNTFFIEALGATASECSNQAVCLEIIIKISKWHQLRQYFQGKYLWWGSAVVKLLSFQFTLILQVC